MSTLLSRASRPALTALAAVALCVRHRHAGTRPDLPGAPVKLLVPWDAGGGSDVVARAFVESAKHFPQPLVVVNRPGAAGAIGHFDGASSKPDGYKVIPA